MTRLPRHRKAARGLPLLALAAALCVTVPAHAQKAPVAAKPSTKYLGLDLSMVPSDQISDLDASVKLVSQGGKLASASLDGCIAPSPVSSRLDRMAGALAVDGTTVRGSGTSEVMRKPWSIEVRQSKAGNAIKVTGRLEYDGKAFPISGEDAVLSDDAPPTGVDEPGEGDGPSAQVDSLNVVEATVPAGTATDLVRLVRESGGVVLPNGVVATCMDLRGGKQKLSAIAAPEKAAGLVAALNAVKGYSARMAQDDANSVLRFPASLLDGGPGGAGETKVAEAVARALVETLPGAAVQGKPTRNASTGRWEVVVQRPNESGATLGLVERDALTFSIGRTGSDAGKALVSLVALGSRFAPDKAQGGTPLEAPSPAEETVEDTGLLVQPVLDRLRDHVGRALKAERLDDESGKWVPFK